MINYGVFENINVNRVEQKSRTHNAYPDTWDKAPMMMIEQNCQPANSHNLLKTLNHFKQSEKQDAKHSSGTVIN